LFDWLGELWGEKDEQGKGGPMRSKSKKKTAKTNKSKKPRKKTGGEKAVRSPEKKKTSNKWAGRRD